MPCIEDYLFFSVLLTMSRQQTTSEEKNQTGTTQLVYVINLTNWLATDFCLLFDSAANKNLLKVAYYKAQLEDYEKAIEIYEQVYPQLTQ